MTYVERTVRAGDMPIGHVMGVPGPLGYDIPFQKASREEFLSSRPDEYLPEDEIPFKCPMPGDEPITVWISINCDDLMTHTCMGDDCELPNLPGQNN